VAGGWWLVAGGWWLVDSLVELASAGHLGRILRGGDSVVAAARSSSGGPGLPYLPRVLRPRLARALGEEAARTVFVGNPARAFAVRRPGGAPYGQG
jgi:phosphotriesterase-related protein